MSNIEVPKEATCEFRKSCPDMRKLEAELETAKGKNVEYAKLVATQAEEYAEKISEACTLFRKELNQKRREWEQSYTPDDTRTAWLEALDFVESKFEAVLGSDNKP